jgi:hypothetical protein
MKDIKRAIKSITLGAAFSKLQLFIIIMNYIENNGKKPTPDGQDYWTEKAQNRLKMAFKEMDITNKIDLFDCFNHLFKHIIDKEYTLKDDLEMEEIAEALKNYIIKCEQVKTADRLKGL